MTAVRRLSVLGLAMLLAAATAVADTVVTAKEVINCWVVWSDTNFTRLKLPNGSIRMLYTRDIRELRLSDPGRVIEQAPQPPQVPPRPDSTQSIPARPVPIDSMACYASLIDTLDRGAAQAAMAAKCREMEALLRERGRSDSSVFDLLGEVNREQQALDGIWPLWRRVLCAEAVGVPVGCVGFLVGQAIQPMGGYLEYGPGGPGDCVLDCGGGPAGLLLGAVVGAIGGEVAGNAWRAALVAKHRDRVNDLVRKVNRELASSP